MGSGVGARRGNGSAGAANITAPGAAQGGTAPLSREQTAASLTPDNTGAVGQIANTTPESPPTPETTDQTTAGYTSRVVLDNPNSESAIGYRAAFGTGSAPTVSLTPEAQTAVRNVFGRPVVDQDLAAMVGAPNGSHVSVASYTPTSLYVSITHPQIVSQTRSLSRNSQGELVMHNNYFRVRDEAPKGFGAAIFAQQVAQARRMGINQIATDAVGNRNTENFNGYYTWARFGYNAPISHDMQSRMPARIRSATMNDLMQKPGGAAWWKENGNSFSGMFDLSPKSTSSRVLNYYFQERGMKLR